jgi:uroporphyrin-III C-methyltransferase
LSPFNLNVRDRLCALVGGGRTACRICGILVDHGARVRVIAPHLARGAVWGSPAVEWLRCDYEPALLAGSAFAIAASDDASLNRRVEADAAALPAVCVTAERILSAAPDAPSAPGRVWLVGAGPGDPGLLTVKAAACMAAADVVIHDGLVDPSILDRYCRGAERVDVSKRKGCCRHLQPEINAMMIAFARDGRSVVRLKGGDPMIFGRGGEEMRALAAAGVAHEVVPGVSTIAAVPALAGIPVTDREYGAASVGVFSLHRRNGASLSEDEWRRMAQGPDTLVLLMGKTLLARIAEKLIQYGRPPGAPVAFIADGTTPRQRRVIGRLDDIAARVDVDEIGGPALIVVGEVVRAAMPLAEALSPAAAAHAALFDAASHPPPPAAPPPAEPAPQATEVLLIRHGEVGEEFRGRYVGRTDPPLSTLGLEHAAALRRHAELARPCARRLASPSLRARQTAQAAGLDVELDDDLREIDFGAWEGLSFAEIAASDPEAVDRWARLDPAFGFPRGESLEAFHARMRRAACRIAEGAPRRVVVVAHGGVIRALVCHWLGLPAEAHLLLEVSPASLTRVRLFDGRGVLSGLNDLSHTAEVIR